MLNAKLEPHAYNLDLFNLAKEVEHTKFSKLAIIALVSQQLVVFIGLVFISKDSWKNELYEVCWTVLILSFLATQFTYASIRRGKK